MSANRFIYLESLFVPRVFIFGARLSLRDSLLFSTTHHISAVGGCQAGVEIYHPGETFPPYFAFHSRSELTLTSCRRWAKTGATRPDFTADTSSVQINNTPYLLYVLCAAGE